MRLALETTGGIMTCRFRPSLVVVAGILSIAPFLAPYQSTPVYAQAATATAPESAKTWLGRHADIEEFLKTAEIVKMEQIPIGVTKPKRVYFAPGGLVESAAWKELPPGIHRGFWDSYKADIAAYELDKLLGLDMVPPVVERRFKEELGAAVMWVKPTKMISEFTPATQPQGPAWDRQVRKMRMFVNLICDKDKNAGNILIDPAQNVILIDHTRAFISSKDLVFKMERFDAELWEKFKKLSQADVEGAIGKWIGKNEIRAILERRDLMAKQIDNLVAKNGADNVLLK
jgi:hypothetical protein